MEEKGRSREETADASASGQGASIEEPGKRTPKREKDNNVKEEREMRKRQEKNARIERALSHEERGCV